MEKTVITRHPRYEYSKLWREKNREKVRIAQRNYKERERQKDGRWWTKGPKAASLMAWMKELKSMPCKDCNNSFEICCMDFDHREGEIKSYNVGSMFAHHYSKELIEKEIAKCDL